MLIFLSSLPSPFFPPLSLQDMMKHAVLAKKAHSELQAALESMLKVLKNLNDSLHVLGVKGFPVSYRSHHNLDL